MTKKINISNTDSAKPVRSIIAEETAPVGPKEILKVKEVPQEIELHESVDLKALREMVIEFKEVKESLTALKKENRVFREKSDPKSENSDITKLERKKERIPLEDRRHLTLVKDPDGYKGRWVNDEGTRIPAFLEAGWELVDRTGQELDADDVMQKSKWRQSALSQNVGNDVVAYYMRTPEKWYKEAQAKKQAKIDQKENQMRSPLRAGIAEDKIYAADIKIEHGKG